MRVRRLLPAPSSSLVVNAGLGVAVLLGAALAYPAFTGPDRSATTEPRTLPVSRATVTSVVSVAGSVRSAVTANAVFATSGTVAEVLATVGESVTEGQVLARLDATVVERELAGAEADLTAARDAVERAAGNGDSSTQAETAVVQAELAVAEARERVDGATLTAPMAGTVVAVNGGVGDSGDAGGSTGGTATGGSSTGSTSAGFVQIADLDRLEVSAGIPEADATSLTVGMSATVSWNALPGTTAGARLAAVDPNATVTNDVVTYGITLSLDDRPEAARPGQSVQVTIPLGTAENVVAVSALAVTSTGYRHTVSVLEDGAPVVRSVELGLQGDQLVEVTTGLREGERVVLPSTGGTDTQPDTDGGRGRPAGGGLPGGGAPGGGRGSR